MLAGNGRRCWLAVAGFAEFRHHIRMRVGVDAEGVKRLREATDGTGESVSRHYARAARSLGAFRNGVGIQSNALAITAGSIDEHLRVVVMSALVRAVEVSDGLDQSVNDMLRTDVEAAEAIQEVIARELSLNAHSKSSG